jgi:hypothetical protein
MSENITHTAVVDDCIRLLTSSPDFCDAFRGVGRDHLEFIRLGAITRRADGHTVAMLTTLRDRWADRPGADQLEEKLAFVLGWLCHRAADREAKPYFRDIEGPKRQGRKSPTDTSVYNDALVFHEVFNGGRTGPYHPGMWDDGLSSLPASSSVDVAALEELIQTLMQRALVELHTFIPDEGDIEKWMAGLFAARQRFYVDRQRYAKAIADPDPELVQRYLVEPNFYDRGDLLIRTARTLQRGESPSPDGAMAVREALSEPPGRDEQARRPSIYECMLRQGMRYLEAANAFWSGRLSSEDLAERFDIGKPGRDGKVV